MSVRAGRSPGKGAKAPPKKYIQFENKRLTAFPPASQLTNTLALSVAKNPLTSLVGLPPSDILQKLILSDTKIETFEGATEQPNLTTIALDRTPLGADKHVIEMALIVFGSQIQIVSGIQVTQQQRDYADAARANLREFLVTGWILTSLRPAKILHRKTRVRKTVHIDFAGAATAKASASQKANSTSTQESIEERIRKIKSEGSTLRASLLRLPTLDDLDLDEDSDGSDGYGAPELDQLLSEMIGLSREWNKKGEEPLDEDTPKEKDEDIFKTADAAAQNNSVVRFRKSMRRKQGPTDLSPPRRTIGSPKRSPHKETDVQKYEERYPYLLQKLMEMREREHKDDAESTGVAPEKPVEEKPTRAILSPVEASEDSEVKHVEEPKKMSRLEELYAKRAPRMENRVKFAPPPEETRRKPIVELSKGRRRTFGATPLLGLVGRPIDEEEEEKEKQEQEMTTPKRRRTLGGRSNSQAVFDMVQKMMADPRGAPTDMMEMMERSSAKGRLIKTKSSGDHQDIVLSPKPEGE